MVPLLGDQPDPRSFSFADKTQVLEFRFPGHPAPPLGMLFKMCTSIESWLLADPKNVAAVHCLTGRGRTSTVLACYLAWVGERESPREIRVRGGVLSSVAGGRALTLRGNRRGTGLSSVSR